MQILALLLLVLGAACTGVTARPRVESLATPSGDGSGMYALTTGGDGHTYLSWVEPVPSGGHALKFSRLTNGAWAPARQIAQGTDWFVNWADHPSVTAARDGRLYAHWLVNTGKKTGAYGYAIRVQSSADDGRSWQTVFEEGVGNTTDYSGFLSFLPDGDAMAAVFLTPLDAGGATAGHGDHADHGGGHIKTVGTVAFGRDGRSRDRTVVDLDACSCCSTDMARTSRGMVAVYRDRDPANIRDISIVRQVDGRWTPPAPVHRDGWMIPGCPTNGPAIAAEGSHVVVTWFTAAGDTARVLAAFSDDAGATFSAPIRVDDGDPVGWAGVALLEGGRTVASWLERSGGGGEVRLREVTMTTRGESLTVATASNGRATGIPMLAREGRDLIVAWRDGRVRTARVSWPASPSPR
jgi:hypothetical protein